VPVVLPVCGLVGTSVAPWRTCTVNPLAWRVPPLSLITLVRTVSVGATSLSATVQLAVWASASVIEPLAAHAPP
jgi:hypothetical protein